MHWLNFQKSISIEITKAKSSLDIAIPTNANFPLPSELPTTGMHFLQIPNMHQISTASKNYWTETPNSKNYFSKWTNE